MLAQLEVVCIPLSQYFICVHAHFMGNDGLQYVVIKREKMVELICIYVLVRVQAWALATWEAWVV